MATYLLFSHRIDFINATLQVSSSGEEVPYVHIPRNRMPSSMLVLQARDWLEDESRPGVFGLLRTSVGYFFAISDPDVAFEFRLRFG